MARGLEESAMKYLCLICADTWMEKMPEALRGVSRVHRGRELRGLRGLGSREFDDRVDRESELQLPRRLTDRIVRRGEIFSGPVE
jgi:hypothetical protein